MFTLIEKHKNRKQKNKGFSLVELLVVVSILAILAAIAIPLLLNQKRKAQDGVVLTDLRQLIPEMETQLRPDGKYPPQATIKASLTSLGVRRSAYYANSGAIPNCTITSATAGDKLDGKYVEWGYWGYSGTVFTGQTQYLFDYASRTWYDSKTDPNFQAKWTSLFTNCNVDGYFVSPDPS